MITKWLIDQSYKILDRDRLHLENVASLDKVNFIFPSENGNNTEENLDKDLPFINTQETPKLTKSQVSFNNPQEWLTISFLALKSFFMEEIYDLRQEI